MKNIIFVFTILVVSLNISAHQLKNQNTHDNRWDWNQLNHKHDDVEKIIEPIARMTPTRMPPTDFIKGKKGLDGIAEVGGCYVPAYVEASCNNEAKRVLVRAAYDETQIIPAVTKEIERRVLVEPAKTIEEYVPALYENISKKILVEPARTAWKKGNFTAITKTIAGETYCLVNVPARYETKIEKVLKVPASTKIRTVPAVYKTYKETVIVKPATTRILKSHPAVYKTVQECVEKVAGHYEWRSVLCEQNATTSVLAAFERALHSSGYLPLKKVDGVIDDDTVSGIKAYQKSRGLDVDGLVNIETVKSLGVKY